MAIQQRAYQPNSILQAYVYYLQRLLPPEYYQIVETAQMQFSQMQQDNKILEIRLQGANECIAQLTQSYKVLDYIAADKQRQVAKLYAEVQQREQEKQTYRRAFMYMKCKLCQYEKAIEILQQDLQNAQEEAKHFKSQKFINDALDEIKFEQDLKHLLEKRIEREELALDSQLSEECDKPDARPADYFDEDVMQQQEPQRKYTSYPEEEKPFQEVDVEIKRDTRQENETEQPAAPFQEYQVYNEERKDKQASFAISDQLDQLTNEKVEEKQRGTNLEIELSNLDEAPSADDAQQDVEVAEKTPAPAEARKVRPKRKKASKHQESIKEKISRELFEDSDSLPDLSLGE